MRSPTSPLLRRGLLALIAILPLGFSSCEIRGPFGLSEPLFLDILAQGNRAAIIGLPEKDFDDPGPDGPAAWYYTALWLLKDSAASDQNRIDARNTLVVELLRRSAAAKGFIRDDARLRLVRLLVDQARSAAPEDAKAAWESVLAAAIPSDGRNEITAARLEALAGLERWQELIDLASSILHGDIGQPSADDGAALYARALAARRLDAAEAGPDLVALLSLGTGPWAGKGLALAQEEGAESLAPPALVARVRLYQAVEARDYGAAWRASKDCLSELRASPTRELVGAVGRAWLFSGMAKQGIALMDEVAGREAAAADGGSPAWAALFYKARMLAAVSRFEEASSLLSVLAGKAGSEKDRDSCLWYSLDARFKAIEAEAPPSRSWESRALLDRALAGQKLAAVGAAANRWSNAAAFDDLVEPFFRDLAADGDWNELDALADLVARRTSPALTSRLLYVSGRARELGLVKGPPSSPLVLSRYDSYLAGPAKIGDGEVATQRFRALLSLEGAPAYYQLAASARLGIDLKPWRSRTNRYPRIDPTRSKYDLAAAAQGLVEFGMPTLAWELAGRTPDAMADSELLDLAKSSARRGSFISSMRFANILADRADPGFEGLEGADKPALPDREVFRLLYPRPWSLELAASLAGSSIPESAAYGLLRSESWFDPTIKSGAGAVGLSQIMPSTAAEIARKLGMDAWSIEDPGDNLRLGMTMLKDLFGENDGHFLRAAFAYNAGRGRLRRWLAESGGYPDDLFLERLSIAETRDYGRKIVIAATWYASLYDGKGSASTVRSLFAGFPTKK